MLSRSQALRTRRDYTTRYESRHSFLRAHRFVAFVGDKPWSSLIQMLEFAGISKSSFDYFNRSRLLGGLLAVTEDCSNSLIKRGKRMASQHLATNAVSNH